MDSVSDYEETWDSDNWGDIQVCIIISRIHCFTYELCVIIFIVTRK